MFWGKTDRRGHWRATAARLALAFTGAAGLSACDFDAALGKKAGVFEQKPPAAITDREYLASVEGFRTSVYAKVRQDCASCHASGSYPRFASETITEAHEVAKAKTDFASPASSLLVLRTKDGHCGTACSTDGAAMTILIQGWKSAITQGQLPVVQWTRGLASVVENVGQLKAEVTLSATVEWDVRIPVAIAGMAKAGEDYVTPYATLLIPAGSKSGSLAITVLDDAIDEDSEVLQLTLGPTTDATLGATSVMSILLTDNDPTPTLRFAVAAQSVPESAGTASITVSTDRASGREVSVPYTVSGTAATPADHDLVAGKIVIPAGQTTATIPVKIVDDAVAESAETITVALAAPVGASLGTPASHVLTVTDNDTLPVLQWAKAAQTVSETVGTVTVSAMLSEAAASAVSAPYVVSGTSSAPDDHSLVNGTVTIAAGQTAASVTFTVVKDAASEPDETVILTLGTPTGAVLGTTKVHTVTLTDSAPPLAVEWSAPSQRVEEGSASAGTAFVRGIALGPSARAATIGGNAWITKSQALGQGLSLGASVVDGGTDLQTPIPATDPETTSMLQTVVWSNSGPLNLSQSLPSGSYLVSLYAMEEFQSNVRSYSLSLEGKVVATGLGDLPFANWKKYGPFAIEVADGALDLSLIASKGNPSLSGVEIVRAGGAGVSVTAQLNTAASADLTVPYSVGGTAVVPGDHDAANGVLRFPAGETRATVSFSVVDDAVTEPDETIVLTLGTPSPGALGTTRVHTVTIAASDPVVVPPVVQWTSASQSVAETTSTFDVTAFLDKVSDSAVTVPITLGGTAASGVDFTAPASLVIPAGQTMGSATIALVGDALDEDNETIVLTLGAPTGATLGTTKVHVATITDDDLPPVVQWSAAAQSVAENSPSFKLTASLSAESGRDVLVPYAVSGTATNPSDHRASNGTLTVPAGAKTADLVVALVNDAVAEPDETAIFTIGAVSNASKGSVAVHTVTITDEDAVANPGQEGFRNSVYVITRRDCVACHASIYSPLHASPDLDLAYTAAKSKVNFADIPASALVAKVKDGHCGAKCMTDGSEMIAAITAWKAAEGITASPTPSPTQTPPAPGGGSTLETGTSILHVAGREYAAGALIDIFGDGPAGSVANELVRRKVGEFAGPCDVYSTRSSPIDVFYGWDSNGECLGESSYSQQPLIGAMNASRQAYLIRACDRILQQDSAVLNAAALAQGLTSVASVSQPSAANAEAVYQMFFVGRTPPAEVVQGLLAVASTAQSKGLPAIEAWRFMLLTTCVAPDWQVP
jgi:hypothetical protein